MGLRDVPAASQPDGHIGSVPMWARARVRDAIVIRGERHRELVGLARVPQPLAGLGLVGVDPFARVDDQLVALGTRNDGRRAVRAQAFLTVDLPPLHPGDLVQGQQVGRFLVIAQKDEGVLVEDGRAAVPPDDVEGGDLFSKMPLPHDLPFMSSARICPSQTTRRHAPRRSPGSGWPGCATRAQRNPYCGSCRRLRPSRVLRQCTADRLNADTTNESEPDCRNS